MTLLPVNHELKVAEERRRAVPALVGGIAGVGGQVLQEALPLVKLEAALLAKERERAFGFPSVGGLDVPEKVALVPEPPRAMGTPEDAELAVQEGIACRMFHETSSALENGGHTAMAIQGILVSLGLRNCQNWEGMLVSSC